MRYLALALLAVTAVAADQEEPRKVCVPGSTYKMDCNTCYCNADGTGQACTFMLCPPKLEGQNNLERAKRQEPRQVCVPGSTYKIDCNTCYCNADGTSQACTLMGCPPKLEGQNNLERAKRQEPRQVCVPGSTYKIDCNTCYCNADGTSQACTLMGCPPKLEGQNNLERPKRQEPRQVCVPGSTYKIDCNTCYCNADGTSQACTLMGCPPKLEGQNNLERPKRQEPRKVCVPGSTYQMDCNTCFCNADGTSQGCTLMRCPPKLEGQYNLERPKRQEPRKVCVPGSTYQMDCNTCFCNADGTSQGCTLMRCPPKLEGQYNLERPKRQEPRKVCVPGSTYKMDCNTCYCNADGTSQACTLLRCPSTTAGEYKVVRPKREVSNVPASLRGSKCQLGDAVKIGWHFCRCVKDGQRNHKWNCQFLRF